MQKKYHIADLHFGHGDSILRFRPQFSSWQEHDQYLVDNINSVVNPTDSLYILGDSLIKEQGLEYLNKINCRNIYLVPGNHDGERTYIKNHPYKRIAGTFDITLGGKRCVMTHIPIHPSCLDRWDINIHGHTHDRSLNNPQYLCISCEQTGYMPVTKEWMLDKINANVAWHETQMNAKYEWQYTKLLQKCVSYVKRICNRLLPNKQ